MATTASLLLHELQAPLEVHRKQHPDVEMSFIDRPSVVAREHLEDGEADVAIVGQIDVPKNRRIESIPVTAYPFVLVCPDGRPLLAAKVFKLSSSTAKPQWNCPITGHSGKS